MFDEYLRELDADALRRAFPENTEAANLPEGVGRDQTTGRVNSLRRGPDCVQIQYDAHGRIASITENVAGRTDVLRAGKDFRAGDATVAADGSINIVSFDGKLRHTLNPDLTCSTREIGKSGDGSDDRLVRVRTREGVERLFGYDHTTGQLNTITDCLHTNTGRNLVEVTKRIGNSNIWQFETNYGRQDLRTNVAVTANGDVSSLEIKRSRPNDLVNTDNSDSVHTDVSAARQHFLEIARQHNVFGSESKTEAWMKKFEQRCHDLAHQDRKAPTDEQICQTYRYLEKILQGQGNVSATHRRWLVEAALKEYADPTKYINQGSHPSCCLAMTERHVVETHPDDHARVLYEAITNKSVLSKFADSRTGKHERLRLTDQQIQPDNEAAAQAKGSGWNAAWSYSNKIFQLVAIDISYPHYRGNGHGFPGAGIDQARHVNRFVDGEKTLPLVNRWGGGKPSFSSLQRALKDGVVGYFVPGHAMAIDGAKVVNGVQYVHIDNWWGGQGDGWRRYDRI
jgi:hypothetical protein